MASMLENEDRLKGELYNAILKEDVEKVIELCERFADHAMHRLTIHEDTVLHVATYSKQTGLVLRLLEALPHHHIHKITTSKNVSGNTVLHEVATLDDCYSVEVATKILEKAPGLLSMRNELGESVLFQSARYGLALNIARRFRHIIGEEDQDEMTALQLLSCMPSAFEPVRRSGSHVINFTNGKDHFCTYLQLTFHIIYIYIYINHPF
ncbi:hypothetical protein CFP56_001015 [Quercus suber]|uniref:Uncharacterized protein n=1 Tax=Quercus suber TaxID=58331 RepID=A0AAW0LGH1_QUESU